MPENLPNFLIIQLARIGDLIQTKRLLLSLERTGRVHLALDAGLAGLAELVFPKAVLHPLRAHAGSRNLSEILTENARTFAGLAEVDFRAVYNLNRNPLALALAGLFPPESVVGYRLERGQPLSSVWCRMAGRWSGAGRRLTSPLNLMDFWAWFHPDPLAPALVNPAAGPGRGGRLGVALAGREARRSLPPEYLARVVEAAFAANKGPEIVLLGSRAEQAAARQLCRRLDRRAAGKVLDLTGKTDLRDFHEVVSGLDRLLTPDTGGMHLAAHLGVPATAFFLSSALAWETGPYGLGHTVWQALRRSCSPCLETAPCPNGVACLPPFAAPWFLAALSGRPADAPPQGCDPALLRLESCFDELGVDYRPVQGDENAALRERRQWKRRFLRECLLRSGPPEASGPAGINSDFVDEIVNETDWMLPGS